MSLQHTEEECAAIAKAPRVSLDDIKESIAAQYDFTANQAVGLMQVPMHPSLNVLSVCLIVMKNGFTIIGKSAPASPGNFNAELGRKLAYEDAVRQIWPLMGFSLRDQLHRHESTTVQ